MLTSYFVQCPYPGCEWCGSLLPRSDLEAWRGPAPTKSVAEFECPRCHGAWWARLVGDDIVPLILDAEAVPSGSR
jgi:hypothetical protein